MKKKESPAINKIWMVLAALCAAALMGAHGEKAPAPGEKAGGGHEAPAGHGAGGGQPARMAFKMGAPLGGFFDRSVLRSGARLAKYRYVFHDVRQTVLTNSAWIIQMSCAVEFGAETGMAEIDREATAAINDLRAALVAVPPDRLLTVPGKIALKEEIARALNRRLTTARVRQVYLTDFLISR